LVIQFSLSTIKTSVDSCSSIHIVLVPVKTGVRDELITASLIFLIFLLIFCVDLGLYIEEAVDRTAPVTVLCALPPAMVPFFFLFLFVVVVVVV
jgi:hypothetical protein